MGCGYSTGTYEEIIEMKELQLGFQHFSVQDFQQAFFYLNDEHDQISPSKLQKGLTILKYHQNKDDEGLRKQFFESIEISKNPQLYSFRQLMIATFLLSNSSLKEKAVELFRFYDRGCTNELRIEDIEPFFYEIFRTVASYSLLFAGLNNSTTNYSTKIDEKVN
eukprot:TRINITY_DN4775_c0_g1_i2.p2 TRINITY_DN4775_c0_g1~~TRINITY_DN4775_c0_g1_i2.p2  ORF type:complete len:164 (+),score=30.71 TRINITY_DN4775_c0_g1_i2:162-653(+)